MKNAVYVRIGGIGIGLISQYDMVFAGFENFLSNSPDGAELRLRICRDAEPVQDGPDFPKLLSIYSEEPLSIYREDRRIVISRGDFRGYINPDSLSGELGLVSEDSLECFLRIVYSFILPGMGGLALHAASVVKGGRAYVFPGKSGAGKTTIAKLSSGTDLLTDEVSIVRGIGEQAVAYGTPFCGELRKPGQNIKAPIAGLYFPVKDSNIYVQELPAKVALEMLLPCVVLFGQEQDIMEKAFHLSYQLASSIPCYELHFRPEPSFWNCIDAKRED